MTELSEVYYSVNRLQVATWAAGLGEDRDFNDCSMLKIMLNIIGWQTHKQMQFSTCTDRFGGTGPFFANLHGWVGFRPVGSGPIRSGPARLGWVVYDTRAA